MKRKENRASEASRRDEKMSRGKAWGTKKGLLGQSPIWNGGWRGRVGGEREKGPGTPQ